MASTDHRYLFCAGSCFGFHDIQTDGRIVVKEPPGIGAVRAYTSDDRRKIDNNVRASL